MPGHAAGRSCEAVPVPGETPFRMRASLFPLCLVASLAAAFDAVSPIPMLSAFPNERHDTIRRVLGSAYSSSAPSSPAAAAAGHVFRPTDFGADPSGIRDSTQAMRKTISALTNATGGARDLGGAVLDLEGGLFLISESLAVQAGFDHFTLQSGTIRASGSFQLGSPLLTIGSMKGGKGSANKDVNIQAITLDGGGRVSTALAVLNGQYVNVGPAVMIYGFICSSDCR